jgi:hypothetical protein
MPPATTKKAISNKTNKTTKADKAFLKKERPNIL